MVDLMIYDRLKEMYSSYMIMKKPPRHRDYIFKADGVDVKITADKRDHRQT